MSKKNSLSLCIIVSLLLKIDCKSSYSQVIPDGSLGSENSITRTDSVVLPTTELIEGGATRGANLFHSFEQFSISTGKTAYFNNALNIQNIISRVTGGSVSNIDGTLRTNGTANLFLLSPNGIIFGPNASLNIGGSFLASTASSMNFADGTQYAANISQTAPLLTVSVPVGLGFTTDSSGSIEVEGTGQDLFLANITNFPIQELGQSFTGLTTNLGRTIALVGGEVNFNGGVVTAPSGRIEVGSITSGLVGIISNLNGIFLDYSGVKDFKNIMLGNRSFLDASGFLDGDIFIHAKNITLGSDSAVSTSNFGSLALGKISINAIETLEVNGRSTDISNFLIGSAIGGIVTQNFSTGKGADVVVSANQVKMQNAGQLISVNFGTGEGGNIDLKLNGSKQIFGSLPSQTTLSLGGIAALTFGNGQAGNITLSAEKLSIQNGSTFASETFGAGTGGKVTVDAVDSVEISGILPISFDTYLPSFLGALTTSSGDAGDLEINTGKLIIEKGGRLDSATLGSGAAGELTINATDSVTITGTFPSSLLPTLLTSSANLADPFFSQLSTSTEPVSGTSGLLTINTEQLNVRDGGQISVRNNGTGNAGRLQIYAGSINLDNEGAITATTASGQGGEIFLQTQNLQSRNNSTITATAGGNGNGGNITIDTNTFTALENSDITANAFGGRGGNIQINAQGLFLSPDSEIRASSEAGPQFDGVVQVSTPDIDFSRATVQPVAGPESPEVASVCQGRSGTAISKLTDTGTGGVPANPTAPLSSTSGWQGDSSTQVAKNSREGKRSTTDKPMQIVEAQGWKRNANGTVSMTAEVLETVQYSSLATLLCSTSQSTVNVENSR